MIGKGNCVRLFTLQANANTLNYRHFKSFDAVDVLWNKRERNVQNIVMKVRALLKSKIPFVLTFSNHFYWEITEAATGGVM